MTTTPTPMQIGETRAPGLMNAADRAAAAASMTARHRLAVPQPIEFQAWPKTPRLNRDMIVTEKIDGTNACVIVTTDGRLGAQSRNRLITPDNDNAGFARWVRENGEALRDILGPGYHYGEWWGSGIQRGYGLTKGEKRFSLFNTHRWAGEARIDEVPSLGVVPTLCTRTFDTSLIREVVEELRIGGSVAAPGFRRPEGVIVYLPAAKQGFKVLLEGDELPKSIAAVA